VTMGPKNGTVLQLDNARHEITELKLYKNELEDTVRLLWERVNHLDAVNRLLLEENR
jgi:hypothetical protein